MNLFTKKWIVPLRNKLHKWMYKKTNGNILQYKYFIVFLISHAKHEISFENI